MTLRQFEIFLAVVRARSFTRIHNEARTPTASARAFTSLLERAPRARWWSAAPKGGR